MYQPNAFHHVSSWTAQHKSNRDAVSRRKIAARILILFALAAASFLCGTLVQVNASEEKAAATAEEPRKIYVEHGDTLWEIAKEIARPGEDIRKVVYDIQKANGLKNAYLREGQELVLPPRP